MRITLNFWAPRETRIGRNVARVYVNEEGAAKGQSLGYFERTEIMRERNPNSTSYYERHRYAKGEDVAYEEGGVAWHGEEALRDRVCEAVFGRDKVGLKENWREALTGDPWGFFRALQERSRGFHYAVTGKSSKDKATRERAKETERQNQQRQTLTFDI